MARAELNEIVVRDCDVYVAGSDAGYRPFLLGTGALAEPDRVVESWHDPIGNARHFLVAWGPPDA